MNTDSTVRYLNLSVSDATVRRELLDAVETVLCHGRIVMGPEVEALEKAIAKQSARSFAVAVSSGSAALYLALRCLDLKPGDEVISPALSWIATFNAIAAAGGEPVAVDIGGDLNINPDVIEDAITPRTRAIVVVHYTGLMCDMEAIQKIARRHDLHIIEDAAQAFSAKRNGKPAGSFGSLAAFSMNPMKVFAAYGEAGAVVGDDASFRERLTMLRYSGVVDREVCHEVSLNYKPDTIQAAMMLVALRHLEEKIRRRREIAHHYTRELGAFVTCPAEPEGAYHVFYDYIVQCDSRDGLKAFFEDKGIEVKVHHEILMPDQPPYKNRKTRDLSVARRATERILSLPCHESMKDGEAERVIEAVMEFHGK